MVESLALRVQGSGFRVEGLHEFRVYYRVSGFRVQSLGLRVQGSGCRVYTSLGFRMGFQGLGFGFIIGFKP